MNRTFILALFSRCQKTILEELETHMNDDHHHHNNDTTTSTAITTPPSPSPPPSPTSTPAPDPRKSYDNAYFYILFVMFFYSFLALALFKNFIQSTKKHPYEEFIKVGATPAHKFNAGPEAQGFDFEDECIL